ncbi:hypothetical protein [Crocinitomix catalasitica]|uniref:hypothetical protein n=1 Tax=Crocinitomix catalasitica TaxID=184607 RepID=UPI00048560F4|nr:hypothetical protein [Crocinitomix catalasitica]
MNIRNVITILITLIILIGCQKEQAIKWTAIEIQITNGITGEAIENIPFSVNGKKSDAGGNFKAKHSSPLEGIIENGYFKGGFKAKGKRWRYHLALDYNFIDTYYLINSDPFDFVLDNFDDNTFELKFVKLFDVSFDMTNEDCLGSSDEVTLIMRHLEYEPASKLDPESDIWEREGHRAFGCESLGGEGRYPAGEYEISQRVKKNGITTYESVLVTIEPNDENVVEIIF